jgi:hypothetical protein
MGKGKKQKKSAGHEQPTETTHASAETRTEREQIGNESGATRSRRNAHGGLKTDTTPSEDIKQSIVDVRGVRTRTQSSGQQQRVSESTTETRGASHSENEEQSKKPRHSVGVKNDTTGIDSAMLTFSATAAGTTSTARPAAETPNATPAQESGMTSPVTAAINSVVATFPVTTVNSQQAACATVSLTPVLMNLSVHLFLLKSKYNEWCNFFKRRCVHNSLHSGRGKI